MGPHSRLLRTGTCVLHIKARHLATSHLNLLKRPPCISSAAVLSSPARRDLKMVPSSCQAPTPLQSWSMLMLPMLSSLLHVATASARTGCMSFVTSHGTNLSYMRNRSTNEHGIEPYYVKHGHLLGTTWTVRIACGGWEKSNDRIVTVDVAEVVARHSHGSPCMVPKVLSKLTSLVL
ncbi:hypothetical protein EV401DRAFT_1997227 [Pisolithus croceorrhizus]|nr:hypothetical protein EV401DRAFT_1997227 [Pisolithus croceorrhizus]